MKTISKLCLAVSALLAMSTAANASSSCNANPATTLVTCTSVPFDAYAPQLPPMGAGQTLVTDFSTTVLGVPPITVADGYHFTYDAGAELHITPLVSGIAAPPAGDATQYLAVLTGGSATLTADKPITSLSILIGSIDQYNEITFEGAGGFSQSYNGFELFPPANGDQFGNATNREFYFHFAAADEINKVVFTSSGNSFEFDNIAAGVPEPRTWVMLILGFGLAGLMLRRRSLVQNLAA